MICSKIFYVNFARKYSIKIKPVVVADENVLANIQNNAFKPKKHPGVMKPKTVAVPNEFVMAVQKVTEDYPVKALLANSEPLFRHLKSRVPPMEKSEIDRYAKKVQAKVLSNYEDVIIKNESDEKRFQQMVQNKTETILRDKIYNWKPINYNVENCLLYLMSRSAPEYAVLVKIFGEIAARDPEFKPKSFFDFGSGVGTGTWAAQTYWKKSIFEYYNVDLSREMNDLSLILLQGGKGTGNLPKGTFYRQFLPASRATYDLVVCAYSLLELPSFQSRLKTLVNLWNKTEQYLVVVEQGTNAGFKVVNEMRDFILQIDNESNKGHVFSPCPHDETCPRFLLNDGTPCNFEVGYFTLPVGQISQKKSELYSYVVLKKGKRDKETDLEWPRIVRSTLVRSKHTICRMCTAKGKLNEVIFTAAKHGKIIYQCARASNWGDRIPVMLDFQTIAVEDVEKKTDDDNTHEIHDDEEAVSDKSNEEISDSEELSSSSSMNEVVENKNCTKPTGDYT